MATITETQPAMDDSLSSDDGYMEIKVDDSDPHDDTIAKRLRVHVSKRIQRDDEVEGRWVSKTFRVADSGDMAPSEFVDGDAAAGRAWLLKLWNSVT